MTTPLETDLPAVAATVLTLAADALDVSAPTRQYRSSGPAAWDFVGPKCDSQLTVWVTAGGTGTAGAPTTGRPEMSPHGLRTFTFTVELARQSATPGPLGQAPTAAQLDAYGATHIGDYQTLSGFVRSLGNSNRGIPAELTEAGVKQVAASTLTTVPPSGGIVGLRAVFVLVV